MNAIEFLKLILPQDGVIFTATLGKKGWVNTSHTSVESAANHVNRLTFENENAYFALATYRKTKVWDGTWIDTDGNMVGKWRTRTQNNAQYIKSFFLDLDIGNDAHKFPSKEVAMAELRAFIKKVGLPRPMILDSGGGFHVYWPLTEQITTEEWKPIAEKFKAICLKESFKADRSLTSDQARVLRVLGSFNLKRGKAVGLMMRSGGTYTLDLISGIFDRYIADNGIGIPRSHTPTLDIPGQPAPVNLPDNLGETNDPLHFDRIAFSCAQLGAQMAVRGENIREPLWRAGIGIVKFCEPLPPAYRAISDHHAEYNEQATLDKISNWRTGPSTCATFHTENPALCEECPHWQKITSPAQLGRMVREAAPVVLNLVDDSGAETTIVIPDPPAPYKRRKNGGVVLETEDREGVKQFLTVCPYDLYPTKILRQCGDDAHIDERSTWRLHLPRTGPVDLDIQQAMMSDTKRLHGHLYSKGAYMQSDEAKATQNYMSAYLQTLAASADREKLYEHLGWNEDNRAFVLGKRTLHADGSSSSHIPSRTISIVTKDGIQPAGTLDGWKEAMNFYKGPGFEGNRVFLYASLGAPLLHMTSHKGVLITASGESGRGKTTCLLACSSLWGQPDSMLLNGNKDGSTVNAFYEHVGTMHSLPVFWDDTTERTPEELRGIMLNIPQGLGKVRMKGSELVNKRLTWATIILGTTNSDNISNIMASGKDVSPHLMRTMNIDFNVVSTQAEAKIRADQFLRNIRGNYGHVGPVFMQYVVSHYDKVKKMVEDNMAMIDRMCASKDASAERIWTAATAASFTAAAIAHKLGLIEFDYATDLNWLLGKMSSQRIQVASGISTPQEILAEFLESEVGSTLTLSMKQASTLDNVVHKPGNRLVIRHEMDTKLLFISRSAIMDYCTEKRTPFRRVEQELINAGVIMSNNVQKTLGAGTAYAKGQIRCWKIDETKISGVVDLQVVQNNVAQMRTAGGTP